MLATVVIPTYKGVDMLRNCSLRSVLNQSYKELEILIVNDGEDLKTKTFCESLNDTRIQYVEIEKKKYSGSLWAVGGSRNRNHALEVCKGDFIFPIDQDDIWSPDFLETRIRAFGDDKIDFVYARSYHVENNRLKSIIGHYPKKEYVEGLKNGNGNNYIPHLTVGYRAKLKHLRYPESGVVPGDMRLWRKMLKNGVTTHFLDIVDSVRNGPNNTVEFLEKFHLKKFGSELPCCL